MKINITKEQVKVVGQAGLKIGKAIIVEGTKAVAIKGATAAITASFERPEGVKSLTLDDVLDGGKKKKNKKKKGLFGRKKEETDIEDLKEEVEELKERVEDVEEITDAVFEEVTKED